MLSQERLNRVWLELRSAGHLTTWDEDYVESVPAREVHMNTMPKGS